MTTILAPRSLRARDRVGHHIDLGDDRVGAPDHDAVGLRHLARVGAAQRAGAHRSSRSRPDWCRSSRRSRNISWRGAGGRCRRAAPAPSCRRRNRARPSRCRSFCLGRDEFLGDEVERGVPARLLPAALALGAGAHQRLQQAVGMVDALGIARDLGADDAGRVAVGLGAVDAADAAVVEQLDVERAGRRAVVRTGRMADALACGCWRAGSWLLSSRKWRPRVGPNAAPLWRQQGSRQSGRAGLILPCEAGEGDHAQHGGGGAPSVPSGHLPRFAGEDLAPHDVSGCSRASKARPWRRCEDFVHLVAAQPFRALAGRPARTQRPAAARAPRRLARPPAGEASCLAGKIVEGGTERPEPQRQDGWHRAGRRAPADGGVLRGAVTPGTEMRGMLAAAGRRGRNGRSGSSSGRARRGGAVGAPAPRRHRRGPASPGAAARASRPRAMTMTSRRTADSAGRSRRRMARWRWRGKSAVGSGQSAVDLCARLPTADCRLPASQPGHGDEHGQHAHQRRAVFLDCQVPVHRRRLR